MADLAEPFVSERGMHGWNYASDAVHHVEKHNCALGCTVPTRRSVREHGPGGDCHLLAALFFHDPIPEFTDGDYVTCHARRPPLLGAPKALSLTRPWDELILLGLKPIENRTWTTTHRGTLVIHAARSWDPTALEVAARNGVDPDVITALGTAKTAPTGYRGTVTLDDVCPGRDALTCTCGPWAFDDQHHWQVSHPMRLPTPIDGRGQLGLWTPPAEVLEQIAGAATEASA